uniref:T-cell immunomodulatory protein n=1 Tax=Cacopsylla melanoneura TaxID=428564 RepID=A0A8D8VKY1_9HEMI
MGLVMKLDCTVPVCNRVLCFILLLVSITIPCTNGLGEEPSNNMTDQVFGDVTDGLPAAFGDFNSDELTDMFVLRDNGHTLQILLGTDGSSFANKIPLLRPAPGGALKCKYKKYINSVVPGDFDGDALMDIMITLYDRDNVRPGEPTLSEVIVLWGNTTTLNCSKENEPLLKLRAQPLAMFYSPEDTIVDLFGEDEHGVRTFWEFNSNRTTPTPVPMVKQNSLDETRDIGKIRHPHSNAFLDLNDDNAPDLFLTTVNNFELWLYNAETGAFVFNSKIPLPPGVDPTRHTVGQSLFLDMELEGKMDHVLPVCFDDETAGKNGKYCINGTIFVYSDNMWHNLKTNFFDSKKTQWGFAKNGKVYTDTITVRGGDFNMDGYPDLLVTLGNGETTKVCFLENAPCMTSCDKFGRDFIVRWEALTPMNTGTVLGVFYDLLQDGILDVILVNSLPNDKYAVSAFKNNLDYDANFVKVMVITPSLDQTLPDLSGPLGKHKRTPGTNLPGPKISYRTSTAEGDPRVAVSTQLPQSAHFALGLPYTIFGLGRTPNFIETLGVGMWNRTRAWGFLIPNSQMVVILTSQTYPDLWKAQLFVTPSKLILQSVLALVSTCLLIVAIIGVLYFKERREDRIDRLREAHRFHFDAM